MRWSYVSIKLLNSLATVSCHTWQVDITVDMATTKPFHQQEAVWINLLKNGDNQESKGLLHT